jgi:hypothetical protein
MWYIWEYIRDSEDEVQHYKEHLAVYREGSDGDREWILRYLDVAVE